MANNASRSFRSFVSRARARRCAVDGILKISVNYGIRAKLGARRKRFVILVKLPLQHSETVKLREKKSGSLAYRADRIVGMLRLPGGKILLCALKIQIVETRETPVQSRTRAEIGCCFGACPGMQCQAEPHGCYHTEDE